MSGTDKDKIKGLVATVVFHAVIVIALVFVCLNYSYPPKDKDLQELKEDEILFGGDYVVLGDFAMSVDNPSPGEQQVLEQNDEPALEGDDVDNAGEQGDVVPPLITQNAEAPMKEVQVAEKPGPTKEELAAEAARVKREKETAEKINKRVSFGNSKGAGSGTSGSPSGSATARTASGAPGVSGLEGYTLANWGRPSSSVQGVVKIQVRVNSRGKVISANYVGGSGSAASNMSVRRSCERASMESQFSVPKNTTTEGVGIITWKFE